jgi:hypothetical protein
VSIASEWESFLVEVIPYDAPAEQKTECRRAFYAGAQAATLFCLSSLEFSQLVADLDAFTEKVRRGGDNYWSAI